MSNNSVIKKDAKLILYPQLNLEDVINSNINNNFKKIILASLNNPLIRQLDKSVVKKKLIEIIGVCIWESGFNIDKEEQKILINYAKDLIISEYSSMTLEEVKLALLNGVRGKYGDVIGINIRMICKWLDFYLQNEKINAMKELKTIKKTDVKEPKISDEEKKYWHSKWLLNCYNAFEHFKKYGENNFNDINNTFYEYLKNKLKIIDLSPEEIKNIWNQAKYLHEQEHKVEKARNFAQRVEFKNVLEKILLNDKTENEKIKIKAKKLALTKFFEKFKLANIDLKKEIIKYEKYDFVKYIKEFENKKSNIKKSV
jgi:hypothetical protein